MVLRKDYLCFSGVLDSTRVVLSQSCAKIRSCTRETLARLTDNKKRKRMRGYLKKIETCSRKREKTYHNLTKGRFSRKWPKGRRSLTSYGVVQRDRGLGPRDGAPSLHLRRPKRQFGHLGRRRWNWLAPSSPPSFPSLSWLFSDVKKFLKRHSMLLAWETRRRLGFVSLLGRGKGSPSYWMRVEAALHPLGQL